MSTSNHPILEYTPIRTPLVMMEKKIKWKPNNIELAPNCPRCASSNTKFCYYNNYSVSQPRYFCKACRRYWTKGGSLRKVPIGGGCRKSRGGRTTRQDCPPPSLESTNDPESGGDIDLAAVFARYANKNAENYESSNFASCEDVQIEDSTMSACGKAVADNQLQQVNEYMNGQDFVYQNYDAFEVEGIFGTELWSEGTNLQSFGSQQAMVQQLQEFEVFSSDDQLRLSENLGTDNWDSFDLSGYENF